MPQLIGEQQRENRRIEHILAVTQKATELFEISFSSAEPVNSPEAFSIVWQAFEENLTNTFGASKDFKLAFKCGEHLLTQFNKSNSLSYSPASSVISNKPDKQTRDGKWLKNAWSIYDQYEAWRKEHLTPDNAQRDVRYQSLILSLIFESGQMNSDVIKAFNQALVSSNGLKLQRHTCYTYVALQLDSSSVNTNSVINGSKLIEHQCYLSLHTLAQLDLWLRADDDTTWRIPEDIKTIYSSITKNFVSLELLPTRLNTFLQCTAFWFETHRNPSISQALIDYRSNRTSSSCLPTRNLEQLIAPNIIMPKVTTFYDFHSQITISKPTKQSVEHSQRLAIDNNSFNRLIQEPFLTKDGKKVSKSTLKKTLNEFIHIYDFHPWQACFVEWLLYKLETCEVSSVNLYRTTLIKDWIYINTELELNANLDNVELEDIYHQQIARHSTEKQKNNFTARLKDLHGFASHSLSLPSLSSSFFHCDATQKHTRAGIVDEVLFYALLSHINTLTDLNNFDKTSLKTLCIIAYRCGLRISEIRKIKMGYISLCEEAWIEVRSNSVASNKTASSLRKVPVMTLLLEHEKEIFGAHLRHKLATTKSNTALFITIGDATSSAFNPSTVSNYVGSFLKSATKLDHFVFYHLRHSSLSRLQCILELEKPFIELPYLCPYDDEQLKKIKTLLFKKTKVKGYWEIAAFAGHEDPSTTFLHYLHMSDILSMPQRSEYLKPIDSKQAIKTGMFKHSHYWKMSERYNKNVSEAYAFSPLYKKLHVEELKVTEYPNMVNVPVITPREQQSLSIEVCYQVLEAISEGRNLDDLVFKYQLKRMTIETWVENVYYIKSIRPPSSDPSILQSRLFKQNRLHAMVPGPLKTQSEKAYLSKFNIKLKGYYKENKDNFIRQINHWLQHISVSESGVTFTDPDTFTDFMEVFSFGIAKAHWRVITKNMKSSTLKDEWRNAYKGLKVLTEIKGTSTGRSGHGSVRLELIHPDEKTIISDTEMSKYSSNLLSYILFFTFVMVRVN
ncbi:tyrosine-type recombinase/integrase [Vibrio gallaecicus]|uniref:tyrosine-type recombinase/integrase n=1 Tax=Vibrio gallaecicus TaxID=552386 RepID=UPI00142E5EB1|nr:tyrosine-type recombinase/integrase [Vibrio gallaecicus]MDN3616769.1 tyrosine-type recombinase/integrase [Vibrio gallaecicus]